MTEKERIIAVDLDGTLTKDGISKEFFWNSTPKELIERYDEVEPNRDMIDYVNKLYDEGNTIYIFTSRNDAYQAQIHKWLKRNGVSFHFFICNKPYFDLLIDDKAMRPEECVK